MCIQVLSSERRVETCSDRTKCAAGGVLLGEWVRCWERTVSLAVKDSHMSPDALGSADVPIPILRDSLPLISLT